MANSSKACWPDVAVYWLPQNKGQLAMITRMDRQIGELFALLKRLKLDEKTVVFFSSDNGSHKEGGNDPEFFDANGPFSGLKRSLTDGGIRVLFIARWPWKIKAGAVSNHVGYFGDVLPTLAELVGAKPPAKHDGHSFGPTLLGRDSDQQRHEFLYWEFYEGGVSQAVLIDGRWKAIRHKKPSNTIELFDQHNDIAEKQNVAANHPELVAKGLTG